MRNPKNYPRISIIICALNEENNLPHILPQIPTWVDETILVDGHSSDNTVKVAREIRPEIKVLLQPNKGKGDALKYGITQATGKIIVTLDADGATNPEEIPRFIDTLLEGYEFAKGSRLKNGRPNNMPFHRWFGNKILVITCNLLYGTRYTDVCSGFNALWRDVFPRFKLTRDGFEMEQEMVVNAKKFGIKVAEVAHRDNGRLGSNSKVSALKPGPIDWLIIVKERF